MLLVYGPRSTTYDFGPGHPLTPRRFGPGIALLEAVGATPGLAPGPVADAELRPCHAAGFIEVVRGFSADPFGLPRAGIAEGGDVPPFAGMHEAGSMVAGGSLRAMDAVLRGDAEHAFHPGGGLHHAMRDRASGFCIYNDVALAVARARRGGLRVLYVDLDVHHGDGVQALFADDPGVLTVSFHESGRYLFPGTGFVDELGEGEAAGTSVNVPLEPGCGEGAWLAAVRSLVPALAAAFGPDVVVSQHGADSHAFDPLAHLRVTTTAMSEAARIVDAVAHRWAGGRWLATGGGGYDAYRVVPRSWSLVWLAGAHREVPAATPVAWREAWAGEAARYGQSPLPETFADPPNAGLRFDAAQEAAEARSAETAAAVYATVVPAFVRHAIDRGWIHDASGNPGRVAYAAPEPPTGSPTLLTHVDAGTWDRLTLAPRVVAPGITHAVVGAAIRDGASISAAVVGDVVVALAAGVDGEDGPELVALGVAPGHRGRGLGTALLASHVQAVGAMSAVVTVAEGDPVEPIDRGRRVALASRMLERAGFTVRPATGPVRRVDGSAIEASIR